MTSLMRKTLANDPATCRNVRKRRITGGVSFLQLLDAIRQVSGLNIVACDINELSPPYDPSGISTATACKVLRELLLALS